MPFSKNDTKELAVSLGEIAIHDSWTMFEGRLNGKPMLIRLRDKLHEIIGHPKLTHRLRVAWKYEVDNASGMPAAAVIDRMEECESSLMAALESDACAVLSHVLTSNGLRQWVFYVSDLDEVGQRINDELAGESYPLELSAEKDPHWAEYRGVLASCKDARIGA